MNPDDVRRAGRAVSAIAGTAAANLPDLTGVASAIPGSDSEFLAARLANRWTELAKRCQSLLSDQGDAMEAAAGTTEHADDDASSRHRPHAIHTDVAV